VQPQVPSHPLSVKIPDTPPKKKDSCSRNDRRPVVPPTHTHLIASSLRSLTPQSCCLQALDPQPCCTPHPIPHTLCCASACGVCGRQSGWSGSRQQWFSLFCGRRHVGVALATWLHNTGWSSRQA
jgi:hypothetical protein